MAKTQKFLIAPIDTGLQNNVKPWLIPNDAFDVLKNAYTYRGRVRKRFGSRLMDQAVDNQQLASRLRVKIGTTNGSGNLAAPATVPGIEQNPGQMFSCGDVVFSVYQDGATLAGAPTRATTATGTFAFAGSTFALAGGDATIAATDVYFYPATPVMGLLTEETNEINDDGTIAFDTQFAYEYIVGGWERLALESVAGDSLWSGSDSQFFWGVTSYGNILTTPDNRLFVVNYNRADGIRNYSLSTNTVTPKTWSTVAYITTGANTLDSSKIVLVFKNRLLALNTLETVGGNDRVYQYRCRYSQTGSLVSAADTFSEAAGKGGFLDAPTEEAIVSARIIKDRLIVFFERSTWELVYQGNQIRPFAWQKINSELGAESTFASVIFDGDIVGVGNVGIHACNGAYVKRVDEKIPELVFKVHNKNAGVERVYGIRDFETEAVYWTFPQTGKSPADTDPKYPNQVLVFNYKNGSWGLNDDTITCFGYYQIKQDIVWDALPVTWEGYDEPWSSGEFQAVTQSVLAGNQEGFTFIISKDLGRNAPALQITNIAIVSTQIQLTIIDHNFIVGEFIRIENCIDNTFLNDNNYEITKIASKDIIEIIEPTFVITPTYNGGGTVTRISKIDIRTKEFNFFIKEGVSQFVPRVDFLVDATENGEITVDTYPSSSRLAVQSILLETSPYPLYPIEEFQDRLWHPIYTQLEGSGSQLRIYLTDSQLLNFDTVKADFQLHAFVFHAMESSPRLGS